MSDLEKLTLAALDLNDETTFTLEELSFKPAEAKPLWAGNADADGEELVEEPHYTNAYFEMQIRVVPAEDTDAALKVLGELLDRLQRCARTEGGLPLEWTPNNASTTYTWYAVLGELVEMPITVTGDLAGWFIESPVVKVKLTCRPFGHTEEREVLVPSASTDPMQVVYVPDIRGDVPARGRVVLSEEEGNARRYAEWGQDVVASEIGNPDLELEADKDLIVTGYSGKLVAFGLSAHSTEVVQATLTQMPLVLCSTGPIEHIGSYHQVLRCRAAGEGALFHVTYRVGDGPWVKTLPWQEPVLIGSWVEVYLGEAFLEAVEKGEQVSEIRIEGKVANGADKCTTYVDTLYFVPARRHGVARAPTDISTPTNLVVGDSFDQAEGSATGKTAEVGGVTYAALTNSDATDFTIAGGKLKRVAVSDTGTVGTGEPPFKGRGIGTSKTFTDLAMRSDFSVTRSVGGLHGLTEQFRFGHVVSYVDDENFVAVLLTTRSIPAGGNKLRLRVWYPHGSSSSETEVNWPTDVNTSIEGSIQTLVLGSSLYVYLAGPGGELVRALAWEDSLGYLGVLGKAYLFDENYSAYEITREYDNLAIWEPDQPVVCPANKSLEIRSDAVERESPGSGTFWSPVPVYRGSSCLLDPAGDAGRVNRLALKMRRGDLSFDSTPDFEDGQAVQVFAEERFLAPR